MQNKRYANIQNGRPTLYVVQRITFYRSSGRATPLSGTCYSPEQHPITANVNLTYRLIIELHETLKDFGNDWRPSRDIFGLRIKTQLVEVLQHT